MSASHPTHEHQPDDTGQDRSGSPFRWLALGGVAAYGLWRWWRGRKADDEQGHTVAPDEIERGHVASERLHFGGVSAFAAGLLVLIATVLGAVALLLNLLERTSADLARAPDVPFTGFEDASAESPLQADPAVDLLKVRRREHRQLSSYGWVDRRRGIVSIPIERAMEILAAQEDSVSAVDPEVVRLLTESGFVELRMDVPLPSSPPFLGAGQEPDTVSPDYARRLGLVNTNSEQE